MSVTHLDALGMKCPLPIIALARLAKSLKSGDVIEIVASDPAAEFDIASWARMKGHETTSPLFTNNPWTVTYLVTLT